MKPFKANMDVRAMLRIVGAGMLAGCLFNLAFGAAVWDTGGLLGGRGVRFAGVPDFMIPGNPAGVEKE